jgi:hypothetical protein
VTALRRPGLYVFVLWSAARAEEERILADLAERFEVLDVVEVTWSPDERFSRSLTRMYGDALPPGSDKEVHCGTGPFLAVVVRDSGPRFRPRHAGGKRKLVNSRVYDARLRYREWTGGGYRVHASDSVLETDRNLVLLFGEGVEEFAARPPRAGVRAHAADPVGTSGWNSVDQLLRALAPYGARPAPAAGDVALRVVASDAWWAEHIAGGLEVGPGVREVQIGGRGVRLRIDQRPGLRVRMADRLAGGLARVAHSLPGRRSER